MSKTIRNYCISALALALLLWFFWNHRIARDTVSLSPVAGDFIDLYLPFYLHTADSLAAGRIPLWNPYQMCGVPYVAVLQGAVFYPPVLLFAVLPPLKAYSLYLMLHMLLGALIILWFCRRLRLVWLPSAAAAVTWLFCANTVEKIFGPAFLASGLYLPLMLVCVAQIIETNRLRWALALAASFTFALLAGWVQTLVYIAYALAAFALAFAWRAYRRREVPAANIRRGLALLLLSAALFLALTAVQTLPTIELGRLATRSFEGLTEEMVTINNTAVYGPNRMLLDVVNSKGGLLPYYLYVGLLPLIFAAAALFSRQHRFYVLFFWTMALCAMLLSMGPQTPLYSLVSHLPLMKMFRAPFRFLFLHAAAISILCGIGLDLFIKKFLAAREARENRSAIGSVTPGPEAGLADGIKAGSKTKTGTNTKLTAALAAATIAALALVFIWPDQPAASGSSALELFAAASHWRYYLLALAALSLICVKISNRAAARLLGAGCVVIIFIDLFMVRYHYHYLPSSDALLAERRAPVETLRSLTQQGGSRAFIARATWQLSPSIKLGQVEKIPLINDYENMNPVPYNTYCRHMLGKSDTSKYSFWGWFNLDTALEHPRLLDCMSAEYLLLSRRYIETGEGAVPDNYALIRQSCALIYQDNDYEIYQNPAALPRAYAVGKYRVCADESEALRMLSSDQFSAAGEVVLLDDPHIPQNNRLTSANVSIASSEPERVVITAETDGDGLLVLTDQYYPGWTAEIDGAPAEILRANSLFRAVRIPAGAHRIVFRYRPRSVLYGAAISLGGLAALGAAALVQVVRRRGTRPQQEETEGTEAPRIENPPRRLKDTKRSL